MSDSHHKHKILHKVKDKVHEHHKKRSSNDDEKEKCRACDYDYDESCPVDRGAKNVLKEKDMINKLRTNREAINKLDALHREAHVKNPEQSDNNKTDRSIKTKGKEIKIKKPNSWVSNKISINSNWKS